MATNNAHKLEEIRQILGSDFTVKGLRDIGCTVDIPETFYTARFGSMNGYGESHDADANIRCLLDKLDGAATRAARFRTVIALVQGDKEMLFEGIVEGTILRQRVGNEGFGYDPVFAPLEADGMAFAQMSAEAKNAISHRGRATKKLAEYLCCRQ